VEIAGSNPAPATELSRSVPGLKAGTGEKTYLPRSSRGEERGKPKALFTQNERLRGAPRLVR